MEKNKKKLTSFFDNNTDKSDIKSLDLLKRELDLLKNRVKLLEQHHMKMMKEMNDKDKK